MKLHAIQVKNYRSLIATQRIELEDGLTVIVGPNNEGKSNLLRTIVLAMQCLTAIRSPVNNDVRTGADPTRPYRIPPQSYHWESDFPRQLQDKSPSGETVLGLWFRLSDAERARFKSTCGSAINGDLPLEIRVGTRGAFFKVRKPGRGSKAYRAKTPIIARFISDTFDFQYIPAIRPSDLSLQVIANLVERELGLLAADPNYSAALQTIEELQKPTLERLGQEVQNNLQGLLPSVKSVEITMPPPQGTTRRTLRVPQLVIDDGIPTDLEAKGDGIKSLAAISLMRSAKAGGAAGALVVAIEEPESHLHPAAVRELATVLRDIAKEHQVVITTHSPLMAVRDKLSANILVSDSKVSVAQSVEDVRSALGVQVQDNLTNVEQVILVEGPTDAAVLESVCSARSSTFKSLIKSGRVAFDSLNGSSNVVYKVNSLQAQIATPILLVDDDDAGRRSLKKADGLVPLKNQFKWSRAGLPHTELEDLISTDCYWAALEKEFGAQLDKSSFEASTKKWSDRMESVFVGGGKPWNASVESNVKKLIATRASAAPMSAIAPAHEPLFDNVVAGIVGVVVVE